MSTPKLQLEPHAYRKSVIEDLYSLHNVNAFDWMKQQPLNSIHAVVTDPPYGLLEYTEKELNKMRRGRGGVAHTAGLRWCQETTTTTIHRIKK